MSGLGGRRAWWFVVALSLAGCATAPLPSDAGLPPDDARIEDGGGSDAGPIDAALDASAIDADLDAGTVDARVIDGGPVSLACLGPARPLLLSHGLPFTTVTVGASGASGSGAFLVDLATTASAIDLRAFGASAPPATGCNPSLLGQACRFADLDFFGPWGTVTLITEDLSGLGGTTEAGILGTDFLSVSVVTLDYRAAELHSSPTACTDAALRGAGLLPLSTAGFYANDLSTVRPMTDVDASALPGSRVPNVPTVGVALAGVMGHAQLDTGFDDSLVPGSVNVNAALFDAVMARDPGALVRDAASDLSLTTCAGVAEPVEAYLLAPGRTLAFPATDGTTARALTGLHVYVKRTPAAAHACGGIGTWTAPAAQIAASSFGVLGTLVVDPFSSRVWVATH